MFLGVPYVPFFLVAGSVLLLGMYINLFVLVLLPAMIFVMRQMARRDEMVFRLLGLHLLIQIRQRRWRSRSGLQRYTPHRYRRRPRWT